MKKKNTNEVTKMARKEHGNNMGDIADMMLTGIICEGCGEYLECNECEEIGIPAYCSKECAKDRGASKSQICNHH